MKQSSYGLLSTERSHHVGCECIFSCAVHTLQNQDCERGWKSSKAE